MKNQNTINKHRAVTSLTTFAVIMLFIFNACKKAPAYKDVVLITGTDVSNIINFAVDGVPSQLAITASATGIVSQDITVAFATDTTLLKAYNSTNGTNFYAPPAGSYNLSTGTATIKAGTAVSSAVALTITSTSKLVVGRNYMIPVVINVTQGNLGVLKSSGTAFIKLNRVITTNAVNFNNGPYISQTFPKNVTLNKFSFEFRVNVSQFASSFHISRVCDFSGASDFNLWRFGELSDAINQLQWINSAGKVSSKTLFATNTWYTVSCVFDGSVCTMYINGVADGSFAAAGQTFNFNIFELGYAGQNLSGNISEFRLWSRVLSPGEIQNGFCGVDPSSAGLLAYWKFNEGQGSTVTDYSGHGYTLSAPYNFQWVSGIKCPN